MKRQDLIKMIGGKDFCSETQEWKYNDENTLILIAVWSPEMDDDMVNMHGVIMHTWVSNDMRRKLELLKSKRATGVYQYLLRVTRDEETMDLMIKGRTEECES